MSAQANRLSLMALLLALCSLVLGIAATVEAFAHHPGSHATRKGPGTVWLEAVATISDGCTTIGSVALGAPAGVAAPPSSEPVTIRLVRPQGAVCTQALGSARNESTLPVPAARASLHLFVVAPDGRVVSSERVPIRP
jgi:hypothetical protein